jgi:hypothetical protein
MQGFGLLFNTQGYSINREPKLDSYFASTQSSSTAYLSLFCSARACPKYHRHHPASKMVEEPMMGVETMIMFE